MYLTMNEHGERLLVTSASDLSRAAECEFAVARDLDARLGRLPAVEQPHDAMLERTSTMGDAHGSKRKRNGSTGWSDDSDAEERAEHHYMLRVNDEFEHGRYKVRFCKCNIFWHNYRRS